MNHHAKRMDVLFSLPSQFSENITNGYALIFEEDLLTYNLHMYSGEFP